MFDRLYNQAHLVYRLEPVTGLLVRSGRDPTDPRRPELEFIRTWAEVGGSLQEVPFLPGSSVKGVVRSHAERILRTLGLRCCDIAANPCIRTPTYGQHCFACRTFGCTSLSSRVRFTDALPWPPDADGEERSRRVTGIRLEVRPGNVVDRRKGSARNFFELEVLTAGAFYGEVTLRNYQLWQLGLLALVIRDLNAGFQRVGGLKSRGLGRVRLTVEQLRFEQWGPLAGAPELRGIGYLQALRDSHDLVGADRVDLPAGLQAEADPFRQVFRAEGPAAEAAWQAVGKAILGSGHWSQFLGRGWGG